MARYLFSRALQLFGLLILPAAIVAELGNEVGLGQSMLISAAGAALFYVGYLIQPRR